MPGVDLNLDLPSLSDSLSTVVSKTATALSTIQDDLAADVVTAELNINAALSMNGSALTDVGHLQMLAGNAPSAAGSFYYYTDGEFYLRTTAGAIKVTSNGSLNTAAAGGFTGDYGLGTETASYNDASGEFRFTEDTGVYADLVCDDLVLMGDNGSVRLGTATGISTARQFLISSLPNSGVSLLVYDASDSGVKDNAVTRATNTVKVTNLDVSGSIIQGDIEEHIDLQRISAVEGVGATLTSSVSGGIPQWSMNPIGSVHICLPIPVGYRLKTFTIVQDSATSSLYAVGITLLLHTTFPLNVTGIGTTSSTSTSGSDYRKTVTVVSPAALTSGQAYRAKITFFSTSTALYHAYYTYDRIA